MNNKKIIIAVVVILVIVIGFVIFNSFGNSDLNMPTNTKEFEAVLYLIPTNDGGRKTPIFNKYSPMFYSETNGQANDIKCEVLFYDGTDKINPGESEKVKIVLESSVTMQRGSEFYLREGGKKIAKVTVTKIIE